MEELLKLLAQFADLAAVPVIVTLVGLIKKYGPLFMDWGKLNALHPLWMSALWYSVRQLGVFMPINLSWALFVLGIIATAFLSVGVHSSGKNLKQWLASKN